MLSHKLVFSESKNFTSGRWILAPPTIPINHYFSPRNQQNRTEVLSYYSMLMYSRNACFKHSNFFKVKDLDPDPNPMKGRANFLEGWPRHTDTHTRNRGGSSTSRQKSNYELFNCNNFNIRYWSWNYRGCWHQTCPPMDSIRDLNCSHSNCQTCKRPALLFFVTTSPCQDWVICAPAAFLGCGSRFSGSLSGIEP